MNAGRGSAISRVGYIGRKFFAEKLCAPAAAGPFLGAHLKTLLDYPPRQGADTLSMKKAIDEAMKKMESPPSHPRRWNSLADRAIIGRGAPPTCPSPGQRCLE